jgi:hypothetical protein
MRISAVECQRGTCTDIDPSGESVAVTSLPFTAELRLGKQTLSI